MNYSNSFYIAMIIGMFAITYGIRFIIFAMAHKVAMPPWLEQSLNFVPVAVLTAIIMPMIFYPPQSNTINISLHNPWLVASFVAFITGLAFRKPLLTIVAGLIVFFALQWLV